MLTAIVLSVLLASDSPPAASPTPQEMERFHAAEANAGRDADAHVRLALWCESHGLSVERAKHLSMAVAADPAHAVARGLMGLVEDNGKWRRPTDLEESGQNAQTLAEYEARRDASLATADAQWRLSAWCDKNALKPQAEAHARAAVRIDPSLKAAWVRLGYKNRNGRWLTDAEISAERREAEAQEQANRVWKPRLAKWRDDLRIPSKRSFTEARLAAVTAPRAVPSIVRVFGTSDPIDQAKLVQVLGQINGTPASRLLAIAAIHGETAEVRRAATETLARRDPREFVAQVIAQVRDLLKYQVQPVSGPGSTGVLLVEGEEYNVRRRYTAPVLPDATVRMLKELDSGQYTGRDMASAIQSGSPVVFAEAVQRRQQMVATDFAEVKKAAYASEIQMERDVVSIENQNNVVRRMNDRALAVLTSSTDGDLGHDREAWAKWWTDRQGYAYVSPPASRAKPTFDQFVPAEYTPQFVSRVSNACFAAGTPVRTREGHKPIENLRVGDLVLSQDVTTGRLGYEPIVAVFHNPPASTVEVNLGDEAIMATGIHRFWSACKGWTMARDLKPGDLVRIVGGTARVASVTSRSTRPVFNLEVAHGRTFFVGKAGALVHDNSLVEATPEPFDAAVTTR